MIFAMDEVVDALNPGEVLELLELPGGDALLKFGIEGVEVLEGRDLRLPDSAFPRLLLTVGDLVLETVQ